MKNTLQTLRGLVLILAISFAAKTAKSQQSLIQVNGWNAYVHLPADYSTTTKTFPTIIFFPGTGEVGTNASLVIENGPGAYLTQGWNGNETIGSSTVEFIVISLQPPATYPVEVTINAEIQSLKSSYRIDNKRLYLTGLSEGGWCCTTFVTGDPLGGPYTYASQVAGIVNVEGVKPDDNSPYPTLFQNFAKAGGRIANFEQAQDERDMQTYTNEMNATVPNSAIYTQTDFGDGSHCCWASFYGGGGTTPSNFTLDGISQNIYQWMARLALVQTTTVTAPVANAGADQTITLPTSSATLSGSGTTSGSITSYQWAQVSGPSTATIASATAASTSVTKLVLGAYKFSLKVVDNTGASAIDTMQVTVNSVANIAPVANAGTDQSITLPTNSITLNGSGTDADGTVAGYQWKQVSGPSTSTITNASSATAAISNLVQGQYSFSLTVTDNNGATNTDAMTVTVNAASGTNGTGGTGSCNTNAPVVYTISGVPDIYMLTPNAAWKGGDTIKIAAGNYTDVIEFDHLHGDPCRPITIINSGGLVYTSTIRLKSDCEYVHITGTGDPKTPYGFKTLSGPVAVDYGHHLEFDHIEITNPVNGVGMVMKSDPDTTVPITVYINGANNYSLNKFHIHDNYIHNTAGEGMYIGHSAPDGGDGQTAQYPNGTYVLPLRMDSVEIDHNILDSTGWDGIQLSNARDGCSIHDNTINHAGVANIGDQQAGIILGGNTTGSIYNNHIQDVTGNGIEVFGYGAISIYNNFVDSAGHDGTTTGQETFFANDIPTVSQPGPEQQIIAYGNTFNDPMPKAALRVAAYDNNSLPSNVHDNKFCIPGATANWQSIYLILNVAGSSNVNNTLYCGPVTPTPIASAGADTVITLPANSISLHGSGTEANGSIVSYKWAKASGPSAGTITTSTSASTTVTGLTAGVYKFTLTVTDNSGLTATDTMQATVNAAPSAPVISSAGTASGITGSSFSYSITASGTPTSYTAAGLPAGLTVNVSTGVISGAPTAAGTFTVTISAVNAGGTGTKVLTITISNPVVPVPVISGASSVTSTTGTTFSYTITASNNPTSYAAAGLPSGLSVNTSTGVISGSPIVAGVSAVTLSASNSGGTASKTLTITIIPAAPAISGSGTASGTMGTVFSYTIIASNSPTSYTATGLPPGLTVNTSTGIISGTPTTTGSFTVTLGAANAGGSTTKTLVITINSAKVIAPVISSAGTASDTVGKTFNYTITASNNPTSYTATGLPAGLAVNTSTGLISGTPTTAGTFTVTISALNAGGTGTETLVITINSAKLNAPVISSAGTASDTVGKTFNYTITASNSPTSYTATGLPAGLTVNTSTGIISGTPTTAGTFTITISALNAGGTGTKTLVITINNVKNNLPVISSANNDSATTGKSFSYTITASNSPASYAAAGLPAGLKINTSTGIIKGTPTATGTFTVTISATNASGTGTAKLVITITPPAPFIYSLAKAKGTAGTDFTYSIMALNNPTSYTATGLPNGLSVNNSTGKITGVPAGAGVFTVMLSAANAGGTDTKTLTITVSQAAANNSGTSNKTTNDEETVNANDIVVMPNPVTQGHFKVSMPGWQGIVTVQIRNFQGLLLITQQLEIGEDAEISINIPALKAGPYILQLSNDSNAATTKFIVQ